MDVSKVQKWELLASPGAVLLQRVNSYRHKTRLPIVLASCSLLLVLVALYVAPSLARGAGLVAGWTAKIGLSAVSTGGISPDPAPNMTPMTAVLPATVQFGEGVPSLINDVLPAMQEQRKVVESGQKVTDCNAKTKITDSWSDGVDMTPKCRYSADGKRLWVWAYVKNESGNVQPFAALIVQQGSKTALASVELNAFGAGSLSGYRSHSYGSAMMPGTPSINPALLPRTVSEDFPELVAKKLERGIWETITGFFSGKTPEEVQAELRKQTAKDKAEKAKKEFDDKVKKGNWL